MTEERLQEIRKIFERYNKNKSEYRQLVVPTISGVSYDKIAVVTDKSKNPTEQMIINYLIDKERITREIELVDKTYDFFADERNIEFAKLIDSRFRLGKHHWQAVNDCYISDRQGLRWLDRVYEKAEEIGERLHIFG